MRKEIRLILRRFIGGKIDDLSIRLSSYSEVSGITLLAENIS